MLHQQAASPAAVSAARGRARPVAAAAAAAAAAGVVARRRQQHQHHHHQQSSCQQQLYEGLVPSVQRRRRRCWCRAAAADAASPPPPPAESPPPPPAPSAAALLPPSCRPHDVLRGVAAGSEGEELFFEVLEGDDGELLLACRGVVYRPCPHSSSTGSSGTALQPLRWQLSPDDALVKALPGWADALRALQQKQAPPPWPAAAPPLVLQGPLAATGASAGALRAAVAANPAPWRDGTGPGDPPLPPLQAALLCAGELEALLAGARGVAMVQLAVGWGGAAAPQPILNPLALHALRRALATPSVCVFLSPAPGGLGLTAVLAARCEPFRAWARHLAGFGAQASLVADSPYYKLLIGRVLGYKEANVRHHVAATSPGGAPPSREVLAAVDADLDSIGGGARPRLPWRAEDVAGAAAAAGSKAAAATGGGGGGGKGRRRPAAPAGGTKQPNKLSRSARKKL